MASFLTILLPFIFLQALVGALKNVPESDKEKIALFFEEAIAGDCFGYTIFGNKPVSLSGCGNDHGGLSFVFDEESSFLREGTVLLRKYRHAFKFENFKFKFDKTGEEEGGFVYIINKKAFRDVVERHLDLFKTVLGNECTAEWLLQQMLTSDKTFDEVLQRHEGLKGILLGYGEHNAMLFQRRKEVMKELSSCAELFPPFSLPECLDRLLEGTRGFLFSRLKKHAKIDMSINTAIQLVEEYVKIETLFEHPDSDNDSLTPVLFPQFFRDISHSETRALLEEYEQTREKILTAYGEGDFLQTIYNKMSETCAK